MLFVDAIAALSSKNVIAIKECFVKFVKALENFSAENKNDEFVSIKPHSL